MKTLFRYLIVLCGLVILVKTGFAQFPNEKKISVNFSLNPIALIDIEPSLNNSIQFSVVANSEAGSELSIENMNEGKLWLNYTSVTNGESRDVKARIESGILPEGIKLKLTVLAYQGSGAGNTGQSVGQVTLAENDQVIITGVGDCYTGDGEQNGHALNFELEMEDFAQLASVNETMLTVLYTISE